MKENWAKNLKQKMAGFQQPVDDSLWAGIEQVSVKTGIRWWPWVLTALASAAVITIVLLLQPEPAIEPIIVSPGEMVAAVDEEPIIGLSALRRTFQSFPVLKLRSLYRQRREMKMKRQMVTGSQYQILLSNLRQSLLTSP